MPSPSRPKRPAASKPRTVRTVRPALREKTTRVLQALFGQHPNAFTELDFRSPFELLVATILSAQATDRGVNEVTPKLFARYPDAQTLAAATPEELEPQIKATGFFRMKAKAIQGMARALVDRHGGQVPADMDALTALPGVGRKTANVVLGHALGVPGLPVDRHVLRVANRLGIAKAATPEEVEAQLCASVPQEQWTLASDTLILHGRRICRPQPLCDRCAAVEWCDFAAKWKKKPRVTAVRPPHTEPPARRRLPR
jgi:endonuclease-3